MHVETSTPPPDPATDHEITRLLVAWRGGDRDAFDRLMPLVFDELRRIARAQFAHEAAGHTLQPTAVIHELYLRLLGRRITYVDSRQRFFAIAARLIRQILVDHARARRALKRGGHAPRLAFDETIGPRCVDLGDTEVVLGVHEALELLESIDPRPARLVELKYFCGLTLREIAKVQDTSLATVERDWSFARRWLARQLSPPS